MIVLTPKTRLFIACVIAMFMFGLLTGMGTAMAAEKEKDKGKMPENTSRTYNERFFFAVPGDVCPPGSEEFTGPENALAKKAGFTYCGFKRMTISLPRKEYKSCPESMVEFKSDRIPPSADYLWCTGENEKNAVLP